MGFKDFCEKEEKSKETKNVENIYNQYKDKNEDELLYELFKHVKKQKDEGVFDYDSLKNMIDKMSPFLSPEQKNKIEDLLEKIR